MNKNTKIKDLEVRLQDTTQAYIQGYDMKMDVYIKPATELKLEPDTYLEVLKPLFGLSGSGASWYHDYAKFLKKGDEIQTY